AVAARIFTRLAGRSALILGAGDMAELAATCLASEGVRVTLVANRTYERARAIAEQMGARALTLDEAWEHFADADIVLSSTAAPHAVVTVLKEFRERLDQVRATELERALRRLAHLSPEDRGEIEHFSQTLLNKFLHQPTLALKEAAQAGRGYGLLEALKRLFGLERRDDP